MNWIAIQPYYKVVREVIGQEQTTVTQDREMYLYHDRIITRYREFGIVDVFDLSYRRMGSGGGIFYLHTNRGVFSYTVNTDPSSFIEAFKGLK
ncbi:hypothetical protein [Paenibacillus spongiae]|uniref:Bacterial Pleckstrin homology domain-containing protein n=1 Tax=Paenibacillus spongiae TaxID=2909671 RepID=A0ABY5SG55_9BACL|nr:hypothetical protein [Paenibacillus spongiae]UVI32957.1 hypothetical protein L1F29_14450 [Paenibacillus spongiae]